jgi:hypothetical protein
VAANDDKRGRSLKARLRAASGYQPVRRPKLRVSAARQPPPLPPAEEPAEGADLAPFGEAEEDGLRMLAALETMPSLEPDFCGDVAAEASVTIIERAQLASGEPPEVAEEAPPGSLRARLGNVGEAPDIDADEYAAYQGPIEEAVVEIVQIKLPEPPPEPPPLPRPQIRRPPRRLFKALTGGS